MSWVIIVWCMIAAMCLTVAALQLMVWLWQRNAWANLLFALSAISVAASSLFELGIMRAQTPAEIATWLRWIHLPIWSLTITLVWFLRLHFRAGRIWLAWTLCSLRTIVLLLNFTSPVSFNFRSVYDVRTIQWPLGEHVAVPVGIPNWYAPLGPITTFLMLVFFVDAAITIWRRRDFQRALLLSSALFFIICALVQSIFAVWGTIHVPFFLTTWFVGIVLAMQYELSRGMYNANRLVAALQESERQVEFAAAAADVGLWSRYVGNGNVWLTKKCREHFGFTDAEQITLDRILAVVHPDDQLRVRNDIDGALRNGKAYNTEYRVMTPEGNIKWLAVHAIYERDGLGRPLLLRGVTLDVTERKRAELQYAREHAELMRLSRAATLGELSGSLAHELNQPLTAILSNAQAALRFLDGKQPDLLEVREILTDIVEDDKRAGSIISNLKNLLKHGQVNREWIDINELIRDTLRLVQSDLMNSGVSARTSLYSELKPIYGDRVQIQQVVLNLIVNACHAMSGAGEKGRRIVLSTAETAGAEIHIDVQDDGCGIPQENLERVFEPLFTTRPEGMGLGLAVCRTIVKAHGGRIWATNNYPHGAIVHIVLPGEGLRGS